MMFATTIQFMALSHATVSVQRMPAKSNGLRKYYRLNFDLMVDVVWIIALIVLIIVVDGKRFSPDTKTRLSKLEDREPPLLENGGSFYIFEF